MKHVVLAKAKRVLERIASSLGRSLDVHLAARVQSLREDIDRRLNERDTVLLEKIARIVRLDRLLAETSREPSQLLHLELTDTDWFWMNTEGYRAMSQLRRLLPNLPSEELQLSSIGSVGDVALEQAFSIYKLFKTTFEKYGRRLADCEAILDYGCGWGRVLRFFLRDLPPDRLWGVDSWEDMVAAARATNPWCHFETVSMDPPTSLPANRFDLIFAFSVFSHLPETTHRKLYVELHRLLRPGGLVLATTWGRWFVQSTERLRVAGPPPLDSRHDRFWKEMLAAFPNAEQTLAEFDAGRFCYHPYRGLNPGGSDFYGEACVPRQYVEEHWSSHFTVLDYVDDATGPTTPIQNLIIARK